MKTRTGSGSARAKQFTTASLHLEAVCAKATDEAFHRVVARAVAMRCDVHRTQVGLGVPWWARKEDPPRWEDFWQEPSYEQPYRPGNQGSI